MAKLQLRQLGDRQGSRQHRAWLRQMIARRIREGKPAKVAAELADLIDRLEQERIRDPLTGAFNRGFVGASLPEIIAAESEHGHGVGLIMLDIDHFKSINDEEPDHHEAGDRVLIALAHMLARMCGHCLVGRWGGEEWAVVVQHTTRPAVVTLAGKIGRQAAKGLAKKAKLIRPQVTVSLGVAMAEDAGGVVGLVKLADNLLYQAKQAGRARLVYHQPGGSVGGVKFV